MLKLNFNPFPVLQTKRLLLRQITDQDANELFALRSNESIMKYLDRPLAKSLDDALELIKKINTSLSNNDGITWAISLQKEKKLSGTIGFWKMEKENYRAEIGYMLHPALQGIGIMDEAVKEIINYGFAKMKLHSIEANINPANAASAKLLEKNNFVKEAYFKENFYYNGKFIDTIIYSLLNNFQE